MNGTPIAYSLETLKGIDPEKVIEIIQDDTMQLLLDAGIITIEEYNLFYHTNFRDSIERQDYINSFAFKNKLPDKK